MLLFRNVHFAVLAAVVIAAQYPGRAQSKEPVPPQEFQERIAAYLALRKTVTDQLPKLKPTPSAKDLTDRQALLASSLAKARAGVAQGDVFTPEVAMEFRRLGRLAMKGSDGARVHKSLKSAEPVQVTVRVNEPYPPRLPLQSTPPTLLMGLPKLPKELEYRLVGRTLVLRDSEANLVVDYLPEAIP
jgi:hypothetical protein